MMHTHTTEYTPTPPTYATALPLPTYEQSEKYEKEGILELSDKEHTRSSDTVYETIPHRSDRGTCCEFTVFFLSKLFILR